MTGTTIDRATPERPLPRQGGGPYPMGLMSLLATVAMLFAAFTAALLVRRTGTDWTALALPPIVWLNTAMLLAASVTVELARAGARRGAQTALYRQLRLAAALGVLFLVGQVLAWRSLAAQGVFLPSSPHAAFFYMLTAVHGAHVLGGIGALAYTLRRARHGAYSPTRYTGLTHTAIYWHFVGGVWAYLLVTLSVL